MIRAALSSELSAVIQGAYVTRAVRSEISTLELAHQLIDQVISHQLPVEKGKSKTLRRNS